MNYWNYRVIKTVTEYETCYSIHEVYYKDNVPWMYAENPIAVGDDIEDLKQVIKQISESLDKPILQENNQDDKPNLIEVKD